MTTVASDTFEDLVAPFHRELFAHCYRILGSSHDAEDVVQETLLAAWNGFAGFEGRSSLRTWLYRIATNKCLNALRSAAPRRRHEVPVYLPEPTHLAGAVVLEPFPGDPPDDEPGPEARYEARESISLAFVTALQHLPPRQRATLVLRDVLGFHAGETAEILGCGVAAVNSSLRRARRALERLPHRTDAPLPRSPEERATLARFVAAFEAGDVAAVVGLLTDDAILAMPPIPHEYHGRAAIFHFLETLAFRPGRRFLLTPLRANGQPAFGARAHDPGTPAAVPHGVFVLTLRADRISVLTRYRASHFAAFDLPESRTS